MNDVAIQLMNCRCKFLDNGKWWVFAKSGDQVVGMLAMEMDAGDWMWLNDLFVAETHRRTGVARLMVAHAIAAAVKLPHVGGVACGVNRENAASLKLFKSLAFEHCYSYPDKEAVLLSRRFGTGGLHGAAPRGAVHFEALFDNVEGT